jgi:effector-binding domain-containing protein
MSYHVEGCHLAEQHTAAVRASLPQDQLAGWLAGVYREVVTCLATARVTPVGPPYARFAFHGDLVDAEAGFPVSAPVPTRGRVIPSTLPGGPVAVTVHYGRYEDLTAAYEAVAEWLKEHGYEPAGPHWEVYYTDPQTEPDSARWRTDLVAPYRTG